MIINQIKYLVRAGLPFFVLICIYFSSLVLLTPVTLLECVKFIFFNIVFVYLFGFILFKLFIKSTDKSFTHLIIGYPVAIFIFIIASIFDQLADLPWLVIFFGLSLIAFIYKSSKIKPWLENTNTYNFKWNTIFLMVFGLIILLQFLFYVLPNLPPTNTPTLIYQDIAWTIGNTWSLINYGYPLQDLRIDNIALGYHILQNIYQYTCFKYAGLDPISVQLYLEPFFDLLNLSLISFYGVKYFLKVKNSTAFLFFLGLIFTGPLLYTSYNVNFFTYPVSMVFGLPFFILFFLILFSHVLDHHPLSLLFLGVCFVNVILTKGHLLIIIPASLIVFTGLSYIRDGYLNKQYLLAILGFCISGILVKIWFFNNSGGSIVLRFIGESIDQINSNNFKDFNFINYLTFWVKNIFSLILPFLLWWPFLFVWLGFFNKSRNNQNISLITLIFIILSIGAVSVFIFVGGEVYFFWYSFIVCLFPFVIFFDKLKVYKGVSYILLAFALISCYQPIKDTKYWYDVGWGDFTNSRRIWDASATISKDEWEGMEWVRTNTPINSVFLTDRFKFNHESLEKEVNRNFYYSMISGRQFFNEGDGFLQGTKNKEIVQQHRLIADSIYNKLNPTDLNLKMVNYIIVSKRFNKTLFKNNRNISLVFENKDLAIYQTRIR